MILRWEEEEEGLEKLTVNEQTVNNKLCHNATTYAKDCAAKIAAYMMFLIFVLVASLDLF